ncbi:alpha/beta hydrolase [Actinocorallia sp. API 0066]|uniref:alpha/beta hydrolase n=1 Tax=Actinocorallia sp. API 0066 TaxID=2896846 RepID=UPI001E5E4709|nr:alpha/beta hydrolase [Actinocorallia sp. API 0066]MCD0452139.1 alpha/beta hydrolase [Actinocorallia sp. API 0066]
MSSASLRTPTHRRRWRRASAALAVLLGAGVLSAPNALADDSGPVAKTGAAATPVLTWTDCGDGFRCATAKVPLDYDHPNGRRVDLAVIKLPASDQRRRIGTLFVNFGGPGAPSENRLRERARWEWLFSTELRARFDLVSWDPRGIGRSTAVRCFATEQEQQDYYAAYPARPVEPADEPAFFAAAKDFSERCRKRAGGLLDHVSTANSARDLELLRRAVGDSRLTYHGLTYGSYLGAVYANMFPRRVRAMAFDGSLDFIGNSTGHGDEGATLPVETRQDRPRGISDTFQEFLRQCAAAGPSRCAFAEAGDPRRKWAVLTERARRAPITIDTPDGPWTYTYNDVVDEAAALYVPEYWPSTADTLQQLYEASGTTGPATRVTTPATRPTGGGATEGARQEQYVNNRDEAFHAIQCTDSDVPRSIRTYSRLAISEDRRIPHFGRIGVFEMMPCATWLGRDEDRYTGPWNAWTANPILVLNNRYDPGTPVHGAVDGAGQLARARLFVTEGAGHTSMFVPSTCTEKVKRDYLIHGTLPAEGTTCGVDHDPFGPR